MSTAVYKVSGPFTASVYYGYGSGDDLAAGFLAGANRTDAEDRNRGDFRLVAENKNNTETLKYEIVGEFDDEFDAWCMRNDFRSTDPRSITGPTMFPTTAFTRAKKDTPDRVQTWSKHRVYETARDAWSAGVFTNDQMFAVRAKIGREAAIKAMDALTPAEFAAQFFG